MASRRDVAGFLADCTGCPTINEIVIKAIEEAQRGGCCALLFVAVLEPFVGVEKKMGGGSGIFVDYRTLNGPTIRGYPDPD